MLAKLKRFAPQWLIEGRRNFFAWRNQRQIISSMPRGARELYRASAKVYADTLSPGDERVRQQVLEVAQLINGDEWNFYSDALRPEILSGFVEAIEALGNRSVRYLEIGSNRGLSMASIGMFLRARGRFASATSIDPYFEEGYREGASGPYGVEKSVSINKTTRDRALALYRHLGLNVDLIEMTSTEGLRRLLTSGKEFDLIYIDGLHEGLVPACDFGMSLACLAGDGIVILDDHMWPDVVPLKSLCDRHATRVSITWKTASYRILR